MKLDLDLKSIIAICTIAATLGGFYYTTQSRLDNLEQEVTTLKKQVKRIARKNTK